MTDKNDVIVRAATEADLDRVAELWTEMIDLHHDLDERFWIRKPDGESIFRDYMVEAIDDEKRVLIVAEVDGAVGGFVHGDLVASPPPVDEKTSSYISDVSVGFAFRGKGIGRKLVDAATAKLAEIGAEDVTLLAAVKNECAVGFYEALGFERHTISMWKSL